MKTTKYIGNFLNFQLEVNCFGFSEAYYLLIAKAISEGKDYKTLNTITDEYGGYFNVNKEPNIFIGRKQ